MDKTKVYVFFLNYYHMIGEVRGQEIHNVYHFYVAENGKFVLSKDPFFSETLHAYLFTLFKPSDKLLEAYILAFEQDKVDKDAV